MKRHRAGQQGQNCRVSAAGLDRNGAGLALACAFFASFSACSASDKSASSGGGSEVDDSTAVKAHMRSDFAAIRRIERALVGGDLAAARADATVFANHQTHPSLTGWKKQLAAVRATSTKLSQAPDLAIASQLVATLGSHCAACHTVSMDRTITFPRPQLAEPTDQRSRMRRHEWAVDRLWEGLIAPSDSSWAEGADVLESAPFMPQLAVREGGEVIETLGQRLHAFGRRAATESSPEGRARIYGELLTTCASCHSLTSKENLR